ncbi:chromosome partitioning protein, partial [Arthrobacter sp. 7Tela_A1]
MSSIPVVTSGSGTAELVQGLERLQGPVTVIRRCGELAELIAACQSGMARAAIVDDDAVELTASLAERLSAAGVALIVLADDVETQERLDALGIRHASGTLDSASFAELVASAVSELESRTGLPSSASSLADPGQPFRQWTLAESPSGGGGEALRDRR